MSEYDNPTNSSIDINSPEFGEGKKEQKSISNASQALQIAQKLAWNDRERDGKRARVLSAFNGASPYNDSSLLNNAQSYRYNVSFGFEEGVIGRAVVPFNDLALNIGDLTEIQANLPDDKLKIVQSEFSKIMDKWGKWPKRIGNQIQDLVLNGFNQMIFPSDYDPFPVFVSQKNGFVDEGVTNDVSDLEVYVWRKSYMIHELYAKIDDESIAKKAGWNVENVKDALTAAVPEELYNKNISTSGQWVAVEEAIRAGALFTSIVGAKMVNTYHVFCAELDGSVSHWIVLDTSISPNGENMLEAVDKPELFKKEKRFKAMQDFLVYFDMETGDGTWHGSKGVGRRAFNTHQAIDKMVNSALDTTFTAGLAMIQPGDQTQQEELTLTVVGPFAVIPNGVQINPQTMPNLSPTFFQMYSLLTNTSEQRLGDVVPQGNLPATSGETATKAKIDAGRQQLITRGNLKRYVDPLSQVSSIIVRRLLKKNSPNAYAKEFQAELKRKGLTDDEMAEIRGARNTGKIDDILGNTAADTQLIFAEFRGDPKIDQDNLYHRRIASVLDADAANQLIIGDDKTLQIEAVRDQLEELTSIQTGKQIPVSPRDDHQAHAETVLQDVGTKVQAQAQNFNPDEIPVLQAEVAHGMEHMNYLKADKSKKAVYSKLEERFKAAEEGLKTLQKQKMDTARAAIDQAAKIAKTPEEMAQVQQQQQALQQQEASI